ncbi:uncharacterized protein LOC119092187 [Pollicipes pollicipes]|uniref:uncharacterized protein LOC119092187 n=1 Tax=Pollicipes pollicipes TaxID=41117 RepID=UPI001884A3AF|nr:uncharacterized protein LOC119092187 [Pollicipes pollicipes]
MDTKAEWPCIDDTECEFLGGMATEPPDGWVNTVKATCHTGQGRCVFPAVASDDSGASRIEMWRSAGHFVFSSQDFINPPTIPADEYNAGSDQPAEEWKYDCSSHDSKSSVMTGMLGITRDDAIGKNIPQDMDLILCTRFLTTHLQVDPTDGHVLDISTASEAGFQCNTGYVLTGVYDTARDFQEPKKAKCSRLVQGTVQNTCTPTSRHGSSNPDIYWNACDQTAGPAVVVGLKLTQMAGTTSREWTLRCCRVSGPATSVAVLGS